MALNIYQHSIILLTIFVATHGYVASNFASLYHDYIGIDLPILLSLNVPINIQSLSPNFLQIDPSVLLTDIDITTTVNDAIGTAQRVTAELPQVDDLLKGVQSVTIDKYNSFLDTVPALQQSAVDYVTDVVSNEVAPKFADTLNVLDKSVEKYATHVTGEVAATANSVVDSTQHVTSQAVSTVDGIVADIQSSVLEKFNVWFESDPRLKKSTSEYVADVLANDVAPKVTDTVEYLEGEAVRVTSDLLNQGDGLVTVVVKGVQSSTLDQFNSWVDSDPRLKKSTSEYVVDVLTNDVTPRVKNAVEFLEDTAEKAATRVATRLSTRLSDAISSVDATVSASLASAQSIANDVSTSISSSLVLPAVDPLTVASSVIPPVDVPSAEELNAKAIQAIQAITSAIVPSVTRAGLTFGGELLKSGEILGRNVGSAVAYTGKGLEGVAENVISAPAKIASTLEFVVPATVDSAASIVDGTTKVASETGNVVQQKLTAALEGVNNWKFFQDDDHWETGYWEQQLKSLSKLKDLKSADLDALTEEISSTLVKAQYRFVERAAEPKAKIDSLVSSVEETVRTVEEISKSTSSKLSAVSDTTSAGLESALKRVNNVVGEAVSVVRDVQQEGQKLGESLQTYATTLLEEGDL